MEEKYWQNIENIQNKQLCVKCFYCRTKQNNIYCKFGLWEEKKPKMITCIPQDFDCPEYEEV